MNAHSVELVEEIQEDPAALFKLFSDPPLVAGPWHTPEPHEQSYYPVYGKAEWRCDPKGDPLVSVLGSSRPKEPETKQFQDAEGSIDWKSYWEAEARYMQLCEVWKPWVWHAHQNLRAKLPAVRYYETKEQAKEAADSFLRDHQVLIWDGE